MILSENQSCLTWIPQLRIFQRYGIGCCVWSTWSGLLRGRGWETGCPPPPCPSGWTWSARSLTCPHLPGSSGRSAPEMHKMFLSMSDSVLLSPRHWVKTPKIFSAQWHKSSKSETFEKLEPAKRLTFLFDKKLQQLINDQNSWSTNEHYWFCTYISAHWSRVTYGMKLSNFHLFFCFLLISISSWCEGSPRLMSKAEPSHPTDQTFWPLLSATSFFRSPPKAHERIWWLEHRPTDNGNLCLPAQLPLNRIGPVQRPHYCWHSTNSPVHLPPNLTPRTRDAWTSSLGAAAHSQPRGSNLLFSSREPRPQSAYICPVLKMPENMLINVMITTSTLLIGRNTDTLSSGFWWPGEVRHEAE